MESSRRFLRSRTKRRRRRRKWTLRSSPHASKAISAPGVTVPPSSVVVSAGGARRVRLRTRTTSSTRTCWDSGGGGVVVDVPVIMQPAFHQSFLFMFVKVPRIHFMIRVPEIPVACSDWYAQCKTVRNTVEISQVQVWWLTFL